MIRFESVSYSYEDSAPALDDAALAEDAIAAAAEGVAAGEPAKGTAPAAAAAPAPRLALNHLSLHIKKGELVAILGANGSGKSTLARHINAIFTPDEGRVLVLGLDSSDPENLLEIRSHAGIVFQNPDSQMVTSIVEDEVAFGPENLGLSPEVIAQRVQGALEVVHMEDHAAADPLRLSGGQRQRVAIASVLAMHPDVVVLDEPSAMLDPRARRGIRRVIHELQDQGITVVLITHSMNEAVHTDRVIVLSQGHVVLDGSPEEVFIQKELLRELGLEVPYSVRLAEALRQRGISVEDTIYTDQLKEELCRLRLNK